MIRSALLRRVFLSIMIALSLMVVLVWILFVYLSDSVFMNLRVSDMMPRAEAFSVMVSDYLEGELPEKSILSLVDTEKNDSSIINAYAIIADKTGNIVLMSDNSFSLSGEVIQKHISAVLAGRKVAYVESAGLRGDIVMMGVPVYDDNGSVSGGLLIYVPQYEVLAARGALAGSLAAAMSIIVPLVFLILYILLYRVIRPLRHMRDVAIRMADGRFDLHANDEISGEIGQLGSSLNRLSKNLKHTISELTFERNRLVHILNGMAEGICAVDSLCNITHINPALEKLFGTNEASDDPHMRVIGHKEIWQAFNEAVLNGETRNFDLSENGTDIRVSISPVRNDKGVIAGAVGLFMDISQAVRLENTRREYVANVSHEMRTPLTAMRGLIEPLRDGMVTNEDAKKRYYDIILREVLRLSRLINDLMELSRLQSGNIALEPEKFRIEEMIDGIFEKYETICQEHSLTLFSDTDFSRFPALYSNPDRVEQMLGILIDNAVKYTPEGGKITLSGTFDENKAYITVKDTGYGISKDHLPHVFERFYKVDKSHSGLGSGLGLSIAKEMLTHMGEDITVRSEEGKGSEFTFTVSLWEKELHA